jgi:hypothetical protein
MKKLWIVISAVLLCACQTPANKAIDIMTDGTKYEHMSLNFLKLECSNGNRKACKLI